MSNLPAELREMADHLWDVEHRINVDNDAKTLNAAADELDRLSALPHLRAGREEWRHKKRGSIYRVITHHAPLQWSSNQAVEETDTTFTVYQSVETGAFYVRPTEEFLDSRFEQLPAGQERRVPEGWQLVPRTTADGRLVEMWEAGDNAIEYITLAEYQQRLPDLIKENGPACRFPLYVDMPKVYAAMLAAAPLPAPPVAEPKG